MFTETYLKTIVGVMKDYYHKYNLVPDYDMLLIKLNERATTEDELQYYTEAIDKLKTTSYAGFQEVQELAEKFFKQQNWIRVANEIKRVVGDGDLEKHEELMKMVDAASSVGRHSKDSYRPFESIEEDLCAESVVSIPTGVDKLDEGLGGGLDKGKIGLIICPMGAGKTSMTTCIAGNAATVLTKSNDYQGFKVLQICFEDKPRDLRRKYISKVVQVETSKLNENKETTKKVKEILAKHPQKDLINNNIQILKLATGEVTATDIKNIIIKKMNEGFKPDLVIVDYFECIAAEKGTSRDDMTTREGKTMRKFETMAEELNIAMWIPTQGNRDSISAELVTNDKVGGSIRKNQIAQVVLSITRSVDDIKNKRAAIAILKNRSGGAGLVLNGVLFDNGTCTIKCDGVVDFDDALAYNEHATKVEETITQSMKNEAIKEMYQDEEEDFKLFRD
jgi:RecA/RadA recombinase